MFTRELCKAAVGVSVLALGLSAAGSPFVGTWKLNATKSKLEGSGLGSDATVRIEQDGAGLRISVDAPIQGQPNNFTYQATLDGKSVKVAGSPAMDEVSTQRINLRTINATAKKDGKVVFTDHRVVSEDGKSFTIQRSGVNPQGQKYQARLVFEKQ
jgi:hypothetical protein